LLRIGSVLLVAALALSCANASSPSRGDQRARDEVRRATERYAALIVAMDPAGIAAAFTVEGEMAVEGQVPVHGREAIRRHLEGFSSYHVLSETLTAETVDVRGTVADAAGRFHQTVRRPDGTVIEAHGAYKAEWVRGEDRTWQIRSMTTIPDRP
jgi:uncharacterized protein (TIGR02246 family)